MFPTPKFFIKSSFDKTWPLEISSDFISVNSFNVIPADEFSQQASELIHAIKETPKQAGVNEIRIPSERAFRERDRRRQEGIVFEQKVVDALNALWV